MHTRRRKKRRKERRKNGYAMYLIFTYRARERREGG